MIRVKKVKIGSDKKITMAYEQLSKSGSWDEYSFTCSDLARRSFYGAMEDLAKHVVEMCELPPEYTSKIEVRGVSVSYGGEKEVMGATISAGMKLENSNCNLNLNTPHKASDSYSDGLADDKQLLPGKCIIDLKALYAECELYINGDRAQTSLFSVA